MIHWIDKGTDEEMSSFASRGGNKIDNYTNFTKAYEANGLETWVFADPNNPDRIVWRTTRELAESMRERMRAPEAQAEPAIAFETEYATNSGYNHYSGPRPNYGAVMATIGGLTISVASSMSGATGDLEGSVSGRPNYGNEKIVGAENLKATFTIKPDGRILIGRVSDGGDDRGWGIPPWMPRGIFMSDVGPLVPLHGNQQPQQKAVSAEQRVGELLAQVYEPLLAAVNAMRQQLHTWNQERLDAEKLATEKASQ